MRFGRRDVGFVELDWRTGERGGGIAPVALQSRHRSVAGKDYVRIVGSFEVRLNIRFLFGVSRMNCIGGSLLSLKGIGDGQSDVLPVVSDHVIPEWGPELQAEPSATRPRGGTTAPTNLPRKES